MVSRRNLYNFSGSKNTRKNDKISPKKIIESIPFENVNPDQTSRSNEKFKIIHNKENKLTRFQLYPETEIACNYNKPQYSEILFEYENSFDMNT